MDIWYEMYYDLYWKEHALLYSTARNNSAMEEVAENMYSANSSDNDRYLQEAHERAVLERKTIEEYIEQIKQEAKELTQQLETLEQENKLLKQLIEARVQYGELRQQNEAQAQRIAELEKKLAESGLTVD